MPSGLINHWFGNGITNTICDSSPILHVTKCVLTWELVNISLLRCCYPRLTETARLLKNVFMKPVTTAHVPVEVELKREWKRENCYFQFVGLVALSSCKQNDWLVRYDRQLVCQAVCWQMLVRAFQRRNVSNYPKQLELNPQKLQESVFLPNNTRMALLKIASWQFPALTALISCFQMVMHFPKKNME